MVALVEKRGLPPETFADNTQYSDAFWAQEQDYLCDVVRQMSAWVRPYRYAVSDRDVPAARGLYDGHM